YRLHSRGGDPLGYLDDPKLRAFVEGGWHDSRAWLAATADTLHPDFVPQVVEMFDSPRAGDIVLFAAEDWAFDTWNSGHGSSLAGDMRVPMYFAGPDLAHGGQIDCARNVDIMPTVLDLLGEAHRLGEVEPIDGQSLAEELRSAGNSVQQSAGASLDSGQFLSDAVSQSPDLRERLVEPLGLD
ncbi:MAG: hypothetical protein IID41_15810, partial [Planctomycetes bacterium]|nr:hypothetical protein [Planctomycetota bacterium]